MALYSTYDSVGIREDISDVITTLTPTKTPFQSSIDNEKVENTLYQWQEDSLRAAAANNQLEGFRAIVGTATPFAILPTGAARTATTMLNNRTQILGDVFEISRTNERVKTYGRKSEIAYQAMKAGAQLKRDLEAVLVGGGSPAVGAQTVTAGNETTARLMGNVVGSIGVSGSTGVTISASTTVAGGTAALTEAMVLTSMRQLYDQGGEVNTLSVKPADASIIAGFAAISDQRIRDFGESKKVVNAVEFYVSPWGEVKVIINRFQLTTVALFYDPENWKLTYIDKWFKEKMAKIGDSEIFMLAGEYGLKHKNRLASGIITAIT